MNLEIRSLHSPYAEWPDDPYRFYFFVEADIGVRGQPGAETFRFVAASPSGLEAEARDGDARFVRGLILLNEFNWEHVRRAIERLLDHARGRDGWDETLAFLNRYGTYSSEDLDGQPYP